jgi:hypothetical protein
VQFSLTLMVGPFLRRNHAWLYRDRSRNEAQEITSCENCCRASQAEARHGDTITTSSPGFPGFSYVQLTDRTKRNFPIRNRRGLASSALCDRLVMPVHRQPLQYDARQGRKRKRQNNPDHVRDAIPPLHYRARPVRSPPDRKRPQPRGNAL